MVKVKAGTGAGGGAFVRAPGAGAGVTVGKIKKLKHQDRKPKEKKVKKSRKLPPGPPPAPPVQELPATRMSDAPAPPQVKWINRQRVLVFAARGINHRHRHLMEDIKKLMPHHKSESKMERSKNLYVVNEMCEMKNCNKCLMFEGRKMRDLYVWMSNIPNGPSAKFLIENVYTMGELKMTGNCLRGTRPLLSFDPQFSENQHYALIKELLTQIFGVPNHHPKSQPFFDHVYTFMILDNRIWFRNYQILSEDGALAEIGPRFVLNPVKIFSGSFGGATLWENSKYISPAKFRQSISKKASNKYQNRVEKKAVYEATRPETGYPDIAGSEMFRGDPMEKAMEVIKEEIKEELKDRDVNRNGEDSPRPLKHIKKAKSKPDMAIRRKQLKAKSKAISDQIKNRKQKGGRKLKNKM